MNIQTRDNNQKWYKISVIEVLIYTLISLFFNFAHVYFQSEFSVENINWNLFLVGTVIWVFGIAATRLSYLYANKSTK